MALVVGGRNRERVLGLVNLLSQVVLSLTAAEGIAGVMKMMMVVR